MEEEQGVMPQGDLATRVVRRRQELALTREEVAQRAGINASYLAYFEENPAAQLSAGALFRLAKALDTTPEVLAGGDVARPPGPGRAGPHPVLDTLTIEQCLAHLASGGVGRVVFAADRGPTALPVNFVVADGAVLFRTSSSATALLDASAVVGFEVDRIDDTMSEGWSVLVTGRAEQVTDDSEIERLGARKVEPWAGGSREAIVRIEIGEISGRVIRQEN